MLLTKILHCKLLNGTKSFCVSFYTRCNMQALFKEMEKSERAFEAIGGQNPGLIGFMELAFDMKDDSDATGKVPSDKTKYMALSELHLVQEAKKHTDMNYLIQFLVDHSNVSERPFEDSSSDWNILLDKPLGKGRVARVFVAELKPTSTFFGQPPKDEKTILPELSCKVSRLPKNKVKNAMKEIACAVMMGELGVGPIVYDAWITTDADEVRQWKKALHDSSAVPGYFFNVMQQLTDVVIFQTFLETNPNPDQLYAVSEDICRRASEMHSIGLLHNDLNLRNILVHPTEMIRSWIIDYEWATLHGKPLTKMQKKKDLEEVHDAILRSFRASQKPKGDGIPSVPLKRQEADFLHLFELYLDLLYS